MTDLNSSMSVLQKNELDEGCRIISYETIHAIIKYLRAPSVEIKKAHFVKPTYFRLAGLTFHYSRYVPHLSIRFKGCFDTYLSCFDIKQNSNFRNSHIDVINDNEPEAENKIMYHVLDYFESSPDYVLKPSKKHKGVYKIYPTTKQTCVKSLLQFLHLR